MTNSLQVTDAEAQQAFVLARTPTRRAIGLRHKSWRHRCEARTHTMRVLLFHVCASDFKAFKFMKSILERPLRASLGTNAHLRFLCMVFMWTVVSSLCIKLRRPKVCTYHRL
jgi:hypothetical protein